MAKSTKIQTKKAACFSGRLRFSNEQIFSSKRPLTCRNLSCRPPPVTDIFAARLSHYKSIKPVCFSFVKHKTQKIPPSQRNISPAALGPP
jgi:hypothetical protein